MAQWNDDGLEPVPEHLEFFRASDWMHPDQAGDCDFDLEEPHPYYRRPRTNDPAILSAYARFRAARASWEREHPEHVQREIAEMVARRIARRRLGVISLPDNWRELANLQED